MCRLLSAGKARAGKGACHLDSGDVEEWNEGLLALLLPDRADAATEVATARPKRMFGTRAYIALTISRRQRDEVKRHDPAERRAKARVASVENKHVHHYVGRRACEDRAYHYRYIPE